MEETGLQWQSAQSSNSIAHTAKKECEAFSVQIIVEICSITDIIESTSLNQEKIRVHIYIYVYIHAWGLQGMSYFYSPRRWL